MLAEPLVRAVARVVVEAKDARGLLQEAVRVLLADEALMDRAEVVHRRCDAERAENALAAPHFLGDEAIEALVRLEGEPAARQEDAAQDAAILLRHLCQCPRDRRLSALFAEEREARLEDDPFDGSAGGLRHA